MGFLGFLKKKDAQDPNTPVELKFGFADAVGNVPHPPDSFKNDPHADFQPPEQPGDPFAGPHQAPSGPQPADTDTDADFALPDLPAGEGANPDQAFETGPESPQPMPQAAPEVAPQAPAPAPAVEIPPETPAIPEKPPTVDPIPEPEVPKPSLPPKPVPAAEVPPPSEPAPAEEATSLDWSQEEAPLIPDERERKPAKAVPNPPQAFPNTQTSEPAPKKVEKPPEKTPAKTAPVETEELPGFDEDIEKPKLPKITYMDEDEALPEDREFFIESLSFFDVLQEIKALKRFAREADKRVVSMSDIDMKLESQVQELMERADELQEEVIRIDTELFERGEL